MLRPFVFFAAMWVLGGGITAVSDLDMKRLLAAEAACGLGMAAVSRLALNIPAKPLLLGVLAVLLSSAHYAWTDRNNVTGIKAPNGAEQKGLEEEGLFAYLEGRIVTPVSVDGDRAHFVLKADHLRWEGGGELFPDEKVQVEIRLTREEEQSAVRELERGYRVRLRGELERPSPARNFGAFDYREHLRLRHIHWLVRVRGLDSLAFQPEGNRLDFSYYLQQIDRVRRFLSEQLEEIFPKEQSGFFQSLLLGERGGLDPELFDQFAKLGLTHLIAISGLHVAIFTGGLFALMGLCGWTREKKLVTAMVLIPLYVLVTGAAPSAIRAGIMAMLGFLAAYRLRLKDGLQLVAAAALIMLIYNPYYLLDVGFQLSFLVTAGLIWGVPRWQVLLPLAPKWLNGLVSVTAVAQIVSFPLTIYYFNQFSVLSFFANFLAVPLVSALLLPLGTAALLAGLLFPALGNAVGWMAEKGASVLFGTAAFLADHDPFLTIWASPPKGWIVLYYALFAGLTEGCLKLKPSFSPVPVLPVPVRVRFLVAACAVGIAILLVWGYFSDAGKRYGEIDFIDVGQGDAILLRSPRGKIVLVDGGGTVRFYKKGEEWKGRRDPFEVGKDVLVPLLKKRGIRRIDWMIATHGDADHVGGLLAVMKEIPVERMVFNGTWSPEGAIVPLMQEALKQGIPVLAAGRGRELVLDSFTRIRFLHPALEEPVPRPAESQNPLSVTFLLEMMGRTFLFPGDIDLAAEMEILSEKPDIPGNGIDLLKVAHHGSRSSTSEKWLAYWRPSLSVISVGRFNIYGHPNREVTERLARHGIAVLRTDLHGEIQVRVLPEGLRLRSKFPFSPSGKGPQER